MVMGNERTLAARLTLKDQLTPQLKNATRGVQTFKAELRRASIQLGIMAGSGSLILRGWLRAADETRTQFNLISSAIRTAGGDVGALTPKIQDLFGALSKQAGVPIKDVAAVWVDLFENLNNPELASQLTGAGLALQQITGNGDAAEILAKALAGEQGAVESLRKMSGIDLSQFNTEAARLDAILTGLNPRLGENKTPMEDFTTSVTNLKDALGQEAATAFGPTLEGLSRFLDGLAANPEFTTFASTFLGLGTAIAAFGAVLAGTAWLVAANPLVAALTAIGVAAVAAFAAGRALGEWLEGGGLGSIFGGNGGGSTATDPVDRGLQGGGESLLHAAGTHLQRMREQALPHVTGENGAAWLAWLQADILSKFPGLTAADLAGIFEWQEIVKEITRKQQIWAQTTPGQQLPGPFLPGGGGEQPSGIIGQGMNVTIMSNGDLDWERRVAEILERERQIGAR